MIKLVGLMVLLYAIQAACSNPGLAFLPVANYLSNTLGFSAAQLAGFQAIVLLPWFSKPLWGLLSDGVPLLGYGLKSYLLLCYGLVVASFALLGCWSHPPASVLLVGILVVSTGVAFSDVLADKLMIVAGQRRDRVNLLQAAQWTGLGLTALVMYLLGAWLADHVALANVFFLSTLIPGMGALIVLYALPEKPDKTFTLGQRWRQFWQALKQSGLKQLLGLILVLKMAPQPVDYLYQSQVLAFDNVLIGNLKAVECLGLGLGAIAFGLLARRMPRLPLLALTVITGAIALFSLAFMQDVASAYGVSFLRGGMGIVSTLALLGLMVQVCPQGAEGFTYALLVSVSNLAANLGLVMGGFLYDWGMSFAGVAMVGAGYLLAVGVAIVLYFAQKIET